MSRAVGIVGRGKIASALMEERKWLRDERRPDETPAVLLDDLPAKTAGQASIYILDTERADVSKAIDSLRPCLAGDGVSVVSAVPGLSLSGLRGLVGPGPALFRAVVPRGTKGRRALILVCPEQGAQAAVASSVVETLEIAGSVEMVAEEMLEVALAVVDATVDSLTLATEGMEEGAVKSGLARGAARALVRQTALTTAVLLVDHPGSPADLKDQVASPGGTTIAGLTVLETQAARGALIKGVLQAAGKGSTNGHT